MSDDVKELLSKAFGEEPPLRIDRDEVLQHGRKRLRRRRFLEAGSVVAMVVVVAVGATMLTNLAGGEQDKKLPPAASSTQHAPPGPELPVTPSSERVAPPRPGTTTITQLPVAGLPSEQQLTALLYAAGVFSEDQVEPLPNQGGPPRFRESGKQFIYEADLNRKGKRGYVEVVVDLTPSVVVDCGNLPSPSDDCEIRTQGTSDVTVTKHVAVDGERTVRATVVSPAGITVTAMASNITRHARELDRPPPAIDPVLSDDELCVLVTKAGLRA